MLGLYRPPITSRRLSSPSASVFDCCLRARRSSGGSFSITVLGPIDGAVVALISSRLAVVGSVPVPGFVPRRRAARVVALRSLTHPVTDDSRTAARFPPTTRAPSAGSPPRPQPRKG